MKKPPLGAGVRSCYRFFHNGAAIGHHVFGGIKICDHILRYFSFWAFRSTNQMYFAEFAHTAVE